MAFPSTLKVILLSKFTTAQDNVTKVEITQHIGHIYGTIYTHTPYVQLQQLVRGRYRNTRIKISPVAGCSLPTVQCREQGEAAVTRSTAA